MELIDIHCHILPGVDDGAKDLEESVNMLRIASDDGIKRIILTPHHHPKRGHADSGRILESFDLLKLKADELFPDMKLYLGNELYCTFDTASELEEQKVFTINKTKYILCEFSTYTDYSDIEASVTGLVSIGYLPIIAHVERYDCMRDSISHIERITESGAYIQINQGSIMGEQGFLPRRFCKKIIKRGLVSFVASDAHDTIHRKPVLSECRKCVEGWAGSDEADSLFYRNQIKVIEGEYI